MGFWERADELVRIQRTTYRWLAAKCGVPETTMSGWRRANVEPRASHSAAIAQALGTTVEYLSQGLVGADPWLYEHRQLLGDLKSLNPEILSLKEAEIHFIAERHRTETGKDSMPDAGATEPKRSTTT